MSTRRLHVDYKLTAGWALPILVAVREKASLAVQLAHWRDSLLSDLAFAIETRIGALMTAIHLVDEGIVAINGQVAADTKNVDRHIEHGPHGAAYPVRDEIALRRVLLGTSAFITEARSLFENLATFYGDFLRDYVGEVVGDKQARYAAIARLAGDPQWVDDLRVNRNDIAHTRAPWLGFTVMQDDPRCYEPFLAFDWRPEKVAESSLTFAQLVAVRDGLDGLLKIVAKEVGLFRVSCG